jgi:hypothetical protein
VHEGDLCSIVSGQGGYKVVKILKLEDDIVHARLYANRFDERPSSVQPDELELGGIDEESFGIGHLPLASGEFEAWQPEAIAHQAVEPDELDGYEEWRRAAEKGEAGVWGVQPAKPRSRLGRLFRRG